MAKPLVFDYAGKELAFALNKVDRSKLYGFKEVEVLDEDGEKCDLATLAGDGRTVVGRGGTGSGYLSPDGTWREKAELKPIDLEGNSIDPVPSSFSAPVELSQRVSVEEYLEHNIRMVYLLECDDTPEGLLAQLREGAIFKFPFSYRGGLEADAGFMLAGEGGEPFMAVGGRTQLEFIGLAQSAAIVEDEDTEEDEEDGFDFDMI